MATNDPQPTTTHPDKLAGFLDSIGSFSEDMILWFNVEERLYHYTDLVGMKGIITADDLWLTHAQYCNDESELTHGLELTKRVIEDQAKNADAKRNAYLAELTKLVCDSELDPVYVCCFCEQDDLLSQWRAYAANATGVSLEFKPSDFRFITGPDCPRPYGLMRFWKVFYPVETQEKIIRSAIDFYPKMEQGATSSEWAVWTAEAIRFFIPTFKNSDFMGEKEWRLIFSPTANSPARPSYRVVRGMLAPYYSLKELCVQLGYKDAKLPMTSVRIGPCPSRKLNAASARMLLDQHGYGAVEVKTSATPYRG